MNLKRIRIRMPKWQAIRSADWAKELLMTFIGATLSIILTFGTAHFLDQKQQREDGRQTAMMVIHDMETRRRYSGHIPSMKSGPLIPRNIYGRISSISRQSTTIR